MAESLGLHAPVKILASDIDTNVLTTASRRVYDAGTRGLSEARLRQFSCAARRQCRLDPGQARTGPHGRIPPFNLMQASWQLGGHSTSCFAATS